MRNFRLQALFGLVALATIALHVSAAQAQKPLDRTIWQSDDGDDQFRWKGPGKEWVQGKRVPGKKEFKPEKDRWKEVDRTLERVYLHRKHANGRTQLLILLAYRSELYSVTDTTQLNTAGKWYNK